jgi:ABC-type lipoprotein release transport system permease subunit
VACIVFLVIIACLVSSRLYAKIPVLDCLRGGINNHNFKRNHFPFEKSSLPVPFTLSLKELFGDKRRNIVLILIVVIITISNNVGFALVGTFGGKTDAILKLSGIEVPVAQITESRDIEDDIRAMECADHIILYYQTEPSIRSGEVTTTVNCDVYDDPSLIENDTVLEGRLPESSKEICLTKKIAKELGVGVGDIIYVDYGGESYDYVVSGLDQKINHMGRKGMFTDEGALRFIGAQDTLMYYIYGKEGYSYDDIVSECGKITSAAVEDSGKMLTETVSTVSNSMFVICIAILAVTGMVVVFVEILLVRSKIIRERRNYGVNKALGFTSGQLMAQTMLSNIPSIMIGVLIGISLSKMLSSYLMSTSLMFFGMEKIDVTLPVYGLALTFVGILAVAMITSFMCSMTIRKVEPVGLLAEE